MDVFALSHHPAAAIFPLLSEEELRDLADDIRANGVKHPIDLIDDGGTWKVLDGRNRIRACKLAGVTPQHVIRRPEDPVAYVISTNLRRRHLKESQRAMVAVEVEKLYAKEAALRERSGRGSDGSGGRGHKRNPTADLPEGFSGRGEARARAAQALNVSPRLVQDAKKVAAKAAPAIVEAVRSGRIAIDDAVRVIDVSKEKQFDFVTKVTSGEAKTLKEARAKDVKAEVLSRINSEPRPLPTGPFRVLVADPPWRYEKRAEDATHRGANPYPDMSAEEICALPIRTLACEDAILWLWTTNAFMRDAFRVIDAWGFSERTILTWVKDRMGTGDWLRGRTEHCILAIRGRPFVTLTNQTTVLEAKLREHSRKPDEFFTMVDALCPGSRVELFAREPRTGWASWGAETAKFGGAT